MGIKLKLQLNAALFLFAAAWIVCMQLGIGYTLPYEVESTTPPPATVGMYHTPDLWPFNN